MLNKTLPVDHQSSPVPDDLIENMGYDSIQKPGLEGLFTIDSLGGEADQKTLFCMTENGQIQELRKKIGEYSSKLVVELVATPKLSLESILEVYRLTGGESTFLTFPFVLKPSRKFYSPQQAHSIVKRVRSEGIEVRPRPDLCAPNSSIDNQRFYEAGFSVLCDRRSSVKPEFSIVTPVYNNKKFALHALRNLNRVYSKDPCFEVIIVDDGSSDGYSESVLQEQEEFQFPFVLINNPRLKQRTMGDFNYRAGLSRNIGVGFAAAERLFLLDCDILIPEDSFEVLREELKTADLIMCQREHLKPGFSSQLPGYSEKNQRHIMDSDHGYWRKFYLQGSDWDSQPDKWRYVCTHSLCLSRDLFRLIGGIPNNYNVYGYEDVELGFRVAQKGGHFKLSKNVTYHLSPSVERSEFAREHHKKMKLLSHSSKIFYFNTLDEEVFEHTQIFWGRPSFFFRLYDIKKKLGF